MLRLFKLMDVLSRASRVIVNGKVPRLPKMSRVFLCHDVCAKRDAMFQERDFLPVSLAELHHSLHDRVSVFRWKVVMLHWLLELWRCQIISILNVSELAGSCSPAMDTKKLEKSVKETLPPALDSSSDPPAIFDGTPKLYISYSCPYAQRAWITRNCKGLQETIKLVPIDLKNRPAWYKEKVFPENKVPSLEHNNEVKGESLDLIRYIDSNFEGPSLFPDDPAKRFREELLDYTGSFYKAVTASFKESRMDEAVSAFDHIETALSKFDDGPFFLGKFSLVDIAYVPFVERFQAFFSEVKNYDITSGRPRLAVWIEVWAKITLISFYIVLYWGFAGNKDRGPE
ncbi:UNVERIFIED_CONTAM: Glutathione S-transferase L1 [Sesamum calycinum]|uniref:Glutathione S-transferase L1 n=1 Tax=Sesamum calycinum TaxID=2727403 RepID=A0AAW2J7I5_9LAMI